MKTRDYVVISGLLFGLVCLGHLLRVIFGWPLVIDTYHVPMAISWIAAFLTAGLVGWGIAILLGEEHGAA